MVREEDLEIIPELLEIDFDEKIEIDDDGNWEWLDQDENGYPKWCASPIKNGSWFGNETNVSLGSDENIYDDGESLLATMLPDCPGRYRITGTFELQYDVGGGTRIINDEWEDEDGSINYDAELDFDDATVSFNYEDSYIANFQIEEI